MVSISVVVVVVLGKLRSRGEGGGMEVPASRSNFMAAYSSFRVL